MAGFHTKTFLKHDDYMTPKSAWENIQHLIPKDKVIWEAFYGDGKSGKDLKELGFQVIHEEIDFYDNDEGDIIVSNPPYSDVKNILPRLKKIGKPFILIIPSSKICTNYFRDFMKDNPDAMQIIIPRKRIQFIKLVNGLVPEIYKSVCNFDCYYFCWKIGLDRDITWLE